MTAEPQDAPLACNLAPDELASRRARWVRLIERALRAKEPMRDGVRLRFCRVAGVEDELDELAAAERQCCASAAWSITRDGPDVVLSVSAAEDGTAAVRALFADVPATPTGAAAPAAE